ncbi:unnamed protein product, partial [Candidula unifasciata]
INIVSQPKHRNAQKRSAGAKTVNNTPPKKTRPDAAGTNQSLQRTLVTLSTVSTEVPNRVTAKPATTKSAASTATSKTVPAGAKAPVVATSWPDVLICGVCKLQFTNLHSLAQHKKIPCQLRVSTQAKQDPATDSGDADEPLILICAVCETEFTSAWALCVHCTEEHNLSIYKTETAENVDGQ